MSSSRPQAVRRLLHDLKELQEDPVKNAAALPSERNIFRWFVTLRGPRDGPYGSSTIHFILSFSDSYPSSPPKLYSSTYFPHRSVSSDAEPISGLKGSGYPVCLSILDPCRKGPYSGWSAAFSVRSVISAMLMLLVPQEYSKTTTSTAAFAEAIRIAGEYVSQDCPHGRKSGRVYPLLNSAKQIGYVSERIISNNEEVSSRASSDVLGLYDPRAATSESNADDKREDASVEEPPQVREEDPVEDGWNRVKGTSRGDSKPASKKPSKNQRRRNAKAAAAAAAAGSRGATPGAGKSSASAANAFTALADPSPRKTNEGKTAAPVKLSKNARKKLQKLKSEADKLGISVEELQRQRANAAKEREENKAREARKLKAAADAAARERNRRAAEEKARREEEIKRKAAEKAAREDAASRKGESSSGAGGGNGKKKAGAGGASGGARKSITPRPPVHAEPVAVEAVSFSSSSDQSGSSFSGFSFDGDQVALTIDEESAALPEFLPNERRARFRDLPADVVVRIIRSAGTAQDVCALSSLNRFTARLARQRNLVRQMVERLHPHHWAVSAAQAFSSVWVDSYEGEHASAAHRCFHSQDSEAVLGVPVCTKSVVPRAGLCSRSAFELLSVRRGLWGSEFDALLPVYQGDADWDASRGLFEECVARVAGSAEFHPNQVLSVLPRLMNAALQEYVLGRAPLGASVDTYTALFRTLVHATSEYSLAAKVDSTIIGFLKKGKAKSHSSLGEVLALYGASRGATKWSALRTVLLRELMARNARVVLEQHPYLEFDETGSDESLELVFHASRFALRMAMMHVTAIAEIGRGVDQVRPLDTAAANVDAFKGHCPQAALTRIATVGAKSAQCGWTEFFLVCRAPLPEPKQLAHMVLAQAVQDSVKAGYHHRGKKIPPQKGDPVF